MEFLDNIPPSVTFVVTAMQLEVSIVSEYKVHQPASYYLACKTLEVTKGCLFDIK